MIYSDSKSAVGMAFDPVAFKKTKRILRAAEFLRDLVAREVVACVRHSDGGGPPDEGCCARDVCRAHASFVRVLALWSVVSLIVVAYLY